MHVLREQKKSNNKSIIDNRLNLMCFINIMIIHEINSLIRPTELSLA